MRSKKTIASLGAFAGLAAGGAAQAAEIDVFDNIAVATVWTADNIYNLREQIYVLPGATLTIEAGTVVASTPTENGSGSLAVNRGARIFVQGTADDPVIMTSTSDVATWDLLASPGLDRDPKTGEWRRAANEWGNLTVMGRGYTSGCDVASSSCSPGNEQPMEGLVGEQGVDILYGGDDDDDNSGSISYLSIRYGGRVIGVGSELNGLSLGAIGRMTNIDHVEIMNNIDDGIEIWGGTVNLKYVSLWNVGDDSFDIDQGWRGKAQFGLICQGFSIDGTQGSGVGDNCFETDGAEEADWQPVTTATVYNFTVIGQPGPGPAGDHGTEWRDNARVQYRNCIFMDLGEQLVRRGTGDNCTATQGYGFGGTLTWEATWTTPYNAVPPHANDCGAAQYLAQSQGISDAGGRLAEISDSVFFRNNNAAAYTEADARGVRAPGNYNVTAVSPGGMPIGSLERAAMGAPGYIVTTEENLLIANVVGLDPTARNDAATSQGSAPNDGFYTPAPYRGAFGPVTAAAGGSPNWLRGWTAADAFGFVRRPPCPADASNNGVVDFEDILLILTFWGQMGGPADVDGSGVVDFADILTVLSNWGPCP